MFTQTIWNNTIWKKKKNNNNQNNYLHNIKLFTIMGRKLQIYTQDKKNYK